MKVLFFSCIFSLLSCAVVAQDNNFKEIYLKFKEEAQNKYNNFRDNANRQYVEFMQRAWQEFKSKPIIPKPEEKPVPPTIFPKDDKKTPIKEKPQPYKEVLPVVEPEPQPQPIAPIRETPQPEEKYHSFDFFLTEYKVRLNDKHRFRLTKCSNKELADAWTKLSKSDYNNAIRDCLELRERYNLCDWAYLLMLQSLSDSFLGKNTNESTLLCAYLYSQSGYQMRLGIGKQRLYLMVASKHQIYNTCLWEINGVNYYVFNCNEKSLQVCNASMPNEKPLSLIMMKLPELKEQITQIRNLQSERYKDVCVNINSDSTMVRFMQTYPNSMIGQNPCTRWAIYANTPLSARMKNQLYPALQKAISGCSQKEAVERLLNFVQTAFVYEYDDVVWGCDRAFFAEETLHYSYCDCEDRSILFSRLVRDLLGLKVLLVYYPGHLATAVHFVNEVKGDYILLNNERYTICDPTYIGAPVGQTMPNMNNGEAKVILLQ